MKISEKRKRLLLELESLVGSECYNANIQNWGPNGVFKGEGRHFRYPITFVDEAGQKTKRYGKNATLNVSTAITGHYAFGANQLHIIRALDKIVKYLEDKHGLSL